ncbi:MAG: hypothetical protein ACRD4S_12465 [Candidatus Acidiferrales bacterium]
MEFSGEQMLGLAVIPLDRASMKRKTQASKQNAVTLREERSPGRPTIGNNFLLGSRNHWLSFFEECWPEIGWQMLQIRKRRSSTIEDVQRLFVKGRPRCDRAEVFLRGSLQPPVSMQNLRRDRTKSSELRLEIQKMQSTRQELQVSLTEAESALKQASEKDRSRIQMEVTRRAELLHQHDRVFETKQSECIVLEQTVPDGETYSYCFELLDFLRSGRRALTPLNFANALAGLPDMRWRQSDARCSKMPAEGYARHPYAVFQIIEHIYRRSSKEFSPAPVDSFRAELLKLSKKNGHQCDFLCEKWRDLKLAIEKSWQPKGDNELMPYAITSAFLNNVSRPKGAVESVLDAHERLVPTKETTRNKAASISFFS